MLPGLLDMLNYISLLLLQIRLFPTPHDELKTLSRGNLTLFTCFGQLVVTGVTVTLTMPCLAHMAISISVVSLVYPTVAGCFLLSAPFPFLSFPLGE